MVKIKDVYEDAEKGIKIAANNMKKIEKPVKKVPYVTVKKIVPVVKLNLK